MREVKVKIALPSEVTVNIPSLSEVPLEDVLVCIGSHGTKLIQEIIRDRVLARFIAEHEEYIQQEVENLLEEKRDEIKKLLTPELISTQP
jgi:hypothetical protein